MEALVQTPSPSKPVNRLIERLPYSQRDQFLAMCIPEELAFGDILCSAGKPMERVHFPLTGFVSLVTPMDSQAPLEVGMIGNEGMVGATLALGVEDAPIRCIVQGSGASLRMSTEDFLQQLSQSPDLRRTVHRYLFVQMGQLAQISACNAFHEVLARLARWLLMTHDRSDSDSLQLTHLFLSDMLGVRRSAVTIAAGELQRRGYIRYTRGRIFVVYRPGLEDTTCDCYFDGLSTYARNL